MNRLYPDRPIAAVGGIIFRRDSVLLVKRGADPYEGRWSIPGGAIELGERAQSALVREVEEETGLRVEPPEIVDVYDSIVKVREDIQYHYVIIDFLCKFVAGEPRPGSDVEDARWVRVTDLDQYSTTPLAGSAISKALKLRRSREG